MAVPAPAIPSGNAYTVNVAHPATEAATEESPLPAFAQAAALLVRRHKIALRMHVSGDNTRVNRLRALLNEAGAKPSAFSPAHSPEIPGEGFWKTTFTVVEATTTAGASGNFWAEKREERKVEWEPLLIALADRVSPTEYAPGLTAIPDVWIVTSANASSPESSETIASRWNAAGAKAVCVLTTGTIAWKSTGALFGQSEGILELPTETTPDSPQTRGVAAAGLVTGMLRDLLGENLFDKTLIRADRECLEMRPLRLGRAVLNAAAALEALPTVATPTTVNPFVKGNGFAEATEGRLVALRGPESKPWAHKGR